MTRRGISARPYVQAAEACKAGKAMLQRLHTELPHVSFELCEVSSSKDRPTLAGMAEGAEGRVGWGDGLTLAEGMSQVKTNREKKAKGSKQQTDYVSKLVRLTKGAPDMVQEGPGWQPLLATSSTCISNPRFLSRVASYDVASNICPALCEACCCRDPVHFEGKVLVASYPCKSFSVHPVTLPRCYPRDLS